MAKRKVMAKIVIIDDEHQRTLVKDVSRSREFCYHYPNKDEFVSKEILSFKDAVKMVKTGEIKDSKTIIALLRYYILRIF